MAMAASTSADSNNDSGFDVFINHREEDVKYSWLAHLYHRLIGKGLRVFLDRQQLQSGDVLVPDIQAAIRIASIHVAIFSPRYATSALCLQQLVLMLESGAPIIPVELRFTQRQSVYAQSLEELAWETVYDSTTLREQLRYDSTTIKRWRNALAQVAKISGFDSDAFNGDEGMFLDKVVQEVLRRAKTQKGSVAKRWKKVQFLENKVPEGVHEKLKDFALVGLHEKLKDFGLVGLHEKLKDFENKVLWAKPQVVGIVGVGGVGKTTLAKELFDRKRVNYSKCCFLPNVREKARLGFLNSLQRQLLKSLTGTDAQMNSIGEGKEALKKHLSSCRVLMVLDDVDHLDQIDALLPVRTYLLSDSLVLITSRDEGVIRSSGVENTAIYQLTGLNHQHSQELFCAHAFNQPNPSQGFESLVDNFLEACEGLPLCLRVLGALVNDRRDPFRWKELLVRIQPVLPCETQKKLQFSYLNLNREEQHMFLDSACFSIGRKRDTAIRIWDGAGWEGRSGFRTLQHRCLLGVDDENNIEMHDHLRDFGRAIADTSSLGRLMHYTDMLEQLSVSA